MTNNTGKLILLTGLFVTALIAANIIAAKLFVLGSVVLTVGIITYPITFLLTDTISEVWGKQWAKRTVWYGFFGSIIGMAYLQLAAVLPHPPFWTGQEAFAQTVALVPRITIAGLLTYLVSQHHDVWAFHFWKRVTGEKHLWLRNNLSTAVSQFIDSVLFVTLAFTGTMPLEGLISLVLGQYVFKLLLAFVDTPMCYLLVRWARKDEVMTSERV